MEIDRSRSHLRDSDRGTEGPLLVVNLPPFRAARRKDLSSGQNLSEVRNDLVRANKPEVSFVDLFSTQPAQETPKKANLAEKSWKKIKALGTWIKSRPEWAVEKISEKRLETAFSHPDKHQRRINYYAFRTLKDASDPLSTININVLNMAAQTLLLPTHFLLYPVYFLKVPVVPLLHAWPIFVSTVITSTAYDINNAVVSLKNGRVARAGFYLLSAFLNVTHLFLFDSYYWELARLSVDRKIAKNSQEELTDMLENPNSSNEHRDIARASVTHGMRRIHHDKTSGEWLELLTQREQQFAEDIDHQKTKQKQHGMDLAQSTNFFSKSFHRFWGIYHQLMLKEDTYRLGAISAAKEFVQSASVS